MIIQVQAISKILAKKDYSFIEDNNLTEDLFTGYEQQFNFIVDHYKRYKTMPDELTFRSEFPNFELVEVTESDEYIIDSLRETGLFTKAVPIFQEAAKMFEQDSNAAVEFIKSKLDTELQPHYSISDEEIIELTDDRVSKSEYINQNQSEFFIPTGFDEIDADINGLQRGEELVVIFARTNMGKSWVSEKIATYIAEIGYRAGYFSPEMSTKDLGYRFDTLHGHISNNAVRLGRFNDEFTIDDYAEYAKGVKDIKGKLFVTRPKDFARKVTVTKLKNWAKTRKLDALFIDGITYLTDERYRKGDSKTISLTNISEDLMDASSELHIPIIVVVQANRGGIVDKDSKDTPELENIRDSDGIAQNASIVYAVRQLKDDNGDTFLLMDNKKMRAGVMGNSYRYKWNIDIGEFVSVSDDDISVSENEGGKSKPKREVTVSKEKRRKKDLEEDY